MKSLASLCGAAALAFTSPATAQQHDQANTGHHDDAAHHEKATHEQHEGTGNAGAHHDDHGAHDEHARKDANHGK